MIDKNDADRGNRVLLELQYGDFEQVIKDNSALYIALHAPGVLLPVSLNMSSSYQ
jgi:hypothetical protein